MREPTGGVGGGGVGWGGVPDPLRLHLSASLVLACMIRHRHIKLCRLWINSFPEVDFISRS